MLTRLLATLVVAFVVLVQGVHAQTDEVYDLPLADKVRVRFDSIDISDNSSGAPWIAKASFRVSNYSSEPFYVQPFDTFFLVDQDGNTYAADETYTLTSNMENLLTNPYATIKFTYPLLEVPTRYVVNPNTDILYHLYFALPYDLVELRLKIPTSDQTSVAFSDPPKYP